MDYCLLIFCVYFLFLFFFSVSYNNIFIRVCCIYFVIQL